MGIKKQYVGIIFGIAMNCFLEGYSDQFESKLCLEQALEIYVQLQESQCPDNFLVPRQDIENCSILCKGRYFLLNMSSSEVQHCVRYTIFFKISETQNSANLVQHPCGISNCLSKDLSFECLVPIKRQNQTKEKNVRDVCFGLDTVIPLTFSISIACCLLGICIFRLINHKRNSIKPFDSPLPPSSVIYEPGSLEVQYVNVSEARNHVNVIDQTSTKSDQIRKSHIRMLDKAVQSPSHQEDGTSRSRENIAPHHQLSGLEGKEESVLFSSDFIPDD